MKKWFYYSLAFIFIVQAVLNINNNMHVEYLQLFWLMMVVIEIKELK